MTDKHVILSATVGSTAYGLAREDSDIDTLGIYVAPLNDVLGLRSRLVVDATWDGHDPVDFCYHEVGKYMNLALQCNPTVLELMFLTDYRVKDEWGQKIIDNREVFLSERGVKGRYGGYAKAQAQRLMRRHSEGKEGFGSSVKDRTEKMGRHCTRLLLQGAELLSTGTVTVDVGDKRDYIFEMGRMALNDSQGFYDHFEGALTTFRAIESVLPEEPNRLRANGLLIDIRLREFDE